MNCNTLILLLLSGQMYCASLGNSTRVDIAVDDSYDYETDSVEEFGTLIENKTFVNKQGVSRINNKTRSSSPLTGCPSKIPTVANGKIVAGRIYQHQGSDLQELACNGWHYTDYAETKYTKNDPYFQNFGSVIVNPGCKLYVFPEYNWEGAPLKYTPGIIPNPPYEWLDIGNTIIIGPIFQCSIPCVRSYIWTCKQTYPSCTPSDSWQTVTELDNSDSSVATKFTYEKMVGTEFSVEMTESMSVSATLSAEISAEFWGSTFTAGLELTTGYDWTKTDSETKSEAKTYSVEIMIPAGAKLLIQEVKGTCGGSTIHTQMFRVIDSINGRMAKAIENKKLGKIIVL